MFPMFAGMIGFLAETTGLEYATVVKPIMDALTTVISWENITPILVGVLGVSVGLAFSWWAMRKGARMLMAAFKKGKVSV